MFFPRALQSRKTVGVFDYTPTKTEYKAMRVLNFTCQCCNFKCVPTKSNPSCGLEFISINGAMKMLCLMCAQSQMLMRPIGLSSGKREYNHGRLVYCPEVSQGKIISVIRDIYCLGQYQKSNPNRALRRYVEELRESYIESILSRCTNIPTLKITNNDLVGYASLYKYASPELLNSENEVFGSIRYIPDEVVYSHVIKQWLNTSYKHLLK